MGTLVIVRHGETYVNVKKGATTDGNGHDLADCSFTPPPGRTVFDLNPRGLEQRMHLARRLDAEFTFDAAFCSSLPRAIETMEPLLPGFRARGIPLKVTEDLRELEHGDFSGIGDSFKGNWRELFDAAYKKDLEAWIAADPANRTQRQFKFRGGESDEEFHGRIDRILGEIASQYEDKTVLVVAHGYTNQALLQKLDSTAVVQHGYGQGNTAVSVLDFVAKGPAGKIRYLGNQDHLPSKLLLRYKFWGT